MNNSFVIPQIAGPGQVVAYTGTHGVIANPLPPGAAAVWIFCTSVAHVKIGASPTATTADFPIPANVPVIIPLFQNNGDLKVSAIQSAAGGNLHVCPLAATG
jgi:hypothetical protein